MKYRVLIMSGGLAVFGVVLAALPSPSSIPSATPQDEANCSESALRQKFEHLRGLVQERLAGRLIVVSGAGSLGPFGRRIVSHGIGPG